MNRHADNRSIKEIEDELFDTWVQDCDQLDRDIEILERRLTSLKAQKADLAKRMQTRQARRSDYMFARKLSLP